MNFWWSIAVLGYFRNPCGQLPGDSADPRPHRVVRSLPGPPRSDVVRRSTREPAGEAEPREHGREAETGTENGASKQWQQWLVGSRGVAVYVLWVTTNPSWNLVSLKIWPEFDRVNSRSLCKCFIDSMKHLMWTVQHISTVYRFYPIDLLRTVPHSIAS